MGDSTFGLSDSMVQVFFSPKSDGAFKWGIAPQVSIQTHTSDRTAGPGWGAGVAGVIFAGSGQWSYGGIVMQHWGDSGDFSILTVQPIVMYAFKSKVGTYLGYNNSITKDWNASSDNDLTVPLGLTFGKTSLLANGNGLDLSVGVYPLVERPDNAPEWPPKRFKTSWKACPVDSAMSSRCGLATTPSCSTRLWTEI